VDWDNNGDIDCPTYADLNYYPKHPDFTEFRTPSPGQYLKGHNDWANLRYRPRDVAVESRGNGPIDPRGEVTLEHLDWLVENLHPVCPSVVRQPCDIRAESGDTIALSIVGAGSRPFAVRWRKDGVELFDSGNILGTDTLRVEISHVAETDAGEYDVVILNSCGSTVSEKALLTITGETDADCTGERRINLTDYSDLVRNLRGPNELPLTACACSDLDHDGDVDLEDFAFHQRAFDGGP